jgi:hypothetical protein
MNQDEVRDGLMELIPEEHHGMAKAYLASLLVHTWREGWDAAKYSG